MTSAGKLANGELDSAINASSALKDLPPFIQSFAALWDKKVDISGYDKDHTEIENYAAQLLALDKNQQSALLSLTKYKEGQKKNIEKYAEQIASGEKLNGVLVETELKAKSLNANTITGILDYTGLKIGDKYGIVDTNGANGVLSLIEQYANALQDAGKKQELLDAGIIEEINGNYKLSQSFIDLITKRSGDANATWMQKLAQDALNVSLQLGKQLLLSLGAAAVSFAISGLVEYIRNLKTESERFVDAMDDAQAKLQDATGDIEEIEGKIDDLNKSIKDTGANQISDIVDPNERARIQAINDMLEAQLNLKKQIEADAKNEANTTTSAVYNDKTKKSITKSHAVDMIGAGGGSNGEIVEVADSITTTESLQEHINKINELTEARRAKIEELSKEGKDYETDDEYKALKKELDAEYTIIENLATELSELSNGYKTDADNFGEVSAEYTACTEAIIAATNALANAKDEVGISSNTIVDEMARIVAYQQDQHGGVKEALEKIIGRTSSVGVAQLASRLSFSSGDDLILNDPFEGAESIEGLNELRALMDNLDFERNYENCLLFAKALELLGYFSDDAVDPFEDLNVQSKTFAELCEELEKVQSAYDVMKTAVKEYNANGSLSADTLSKLIQLDPKYLKALTDENGQIQLNEESLLNLADSYYELMKAKLVSKAIDTLKEMDTYKEAAEYLQQAKQETKDWLGLLQETASTVLETSGLSGDAFATLNEAQQEYIKSIAAMLELITKTQETDPLNKNKTSTSSSSAIDAWSTLSSAMEEYNKNGSICLSTMKSLMGLEAKYTSLLKKQGNELVIDAEAYRKLIQKELAHAAATDEGKNKVAQYNQILKYLDENAKNGVISLNQLENAINGTSAAIEKALAETDRYQSALQTLHELKTLSNPNSGGTEGLFNTDGLLDYDTVKKVTDLINNYPDISGILIDENGNLKVDQESLNRAMATVVGDMISAAEDSNQDGLAQFWRNQLNNIDTGKISWEDFWNGFATGMEDANTKLDDFQSNFTTLKEAMEEFNKYGAVSQDTLQKISEMDSSYSEHLTKDEETGEYKLDAKGYRDAYVERLSGYVERFKGTPYGEQLLAMIEAVREPTKEEYDEMARNTVEYLTAAARHDKELAKIESMSGLTDEEKQMLIEQAGSELQAVYTQAFESVQETGARCLEKLEDHFGELGKSAENFKTTLSNIKSLLETFLGIFEKINSNKSDDLSLWGDAVQDELDARIEALEKQKEALNDNNDALERAIELSRLQDELERAKSQKTARVYTSNGYEWQSDASALRDAQQNLSDKQREWKKEDAEKAIDDQIDKLNELKDKYSEAMEDIGKSLDEYNKKLKYAAQLHGMTFTEIEGQLGSYKENIIASLNDANVITGIQNTISNISTLIETLETLNNVLTWFTSGGTSTDGGGFSGLLKTLGKIFNGEFGAEVKTGLNSIKNSVVEWATTGGGKTIFDSITGVFKNVVSGVGNILGSGGSGGLSGIVKTALGTVGTVAKNAGSGIVKTVGTIATKVGGALGIGSTAGAAAGTAGASAGILGTVAKAGGAILSAVGGASSGALGVIGSALALGVNTNVQMHKKNKEIWSDDSKSTGSKVLSTVGNAFWSLSPVGMIANGVKSIGGVVKKIFGIQDKESKKDDTPIENTTTNVSSNTSITNITTNGTKTTEETQTSSSSSSTSTSETSSSGGEKKQSLWDKIVGWKGWFWNWGKKASGDKNIKQRGIYNVDEQGSEILVRKPQSGRYTYLETGDGVIPADITSRLFEMGGNPDKWFAEQMAKHNAANMIQNRTSGGTSYNIGDININNPVGDSDALARDIVTRLPSCVDQQMNKR